MTNFEKYKTPEELFAAHVEYCKEIGKAVNYDCKRCNGNPKHGNCPCLITFAYKNCRGEREMTNEEENDMFTEEILWHKVKIRPMTEEEKQEYADMDIDAEEIYVGRMPEDGQEILVKTKWGVESDVAINDDFIGLEGRGDWEDVEYWAEMPKAEPNLPPLRCRRKIND